MHLVKSSPEIEKMRLAGKIHRQVMLELMAAVRPGISTLSLDELAERRIRELGGVPSFKGFHGFPASICTSINEEIVHGIPRADRHLNNGDLLKLDMGVIFDGWHADAGRTVGVGEINPVAYELMLAAESSFAAGIEGIRAGQPLNRIGKQVQAHAEALGYSVVRDLIGHGVGSQLHEDPEVPNYYRPDLTLSLKAGMTLAIEPMINLGTAHIRQLPDNWTIITTDRKLSSYYENTVLITQSGCEILT